MPTENPSRCEIPSNHFRRIVVPTRDCRPGAVETQPRAILRRSGVPAYSRMMRQFDDAHRQPSSGKTANPASILVVDPDPLSLIAMAGVLHTQGYQCTCARSGDAAKTALRNARMDLVLWDVADDAAGVLDSLAAMRKLADCHQLPAILVAESRWAGLEGKVDSMAAPTRCLFKPIDPNSLFAVVENILCMPSLIAAHRRKGSTPSRPGWITL